MYQDAMRIGFEVDPEIEATDRRDPELSRGVPGTIGTGWTAWRSTHGLEAALL